MHPDPKPDGDDDPVAPFDSCVACYRGDTTTALVFRGEAEWAAAGLHVLGVSESEALATIELFAEQELGSPPGTVPAGTLDLAVRVCPSCAKRAGFPIGNVRDRLPVVAQALDGES